MVDIVVELAINAVTRNVAKKTDELGLPHSLEVALTANQRDESVTSFQQSFLCHLLKEAEVDLVKYGCESKALKSRNIWNFSYPDNGMFDYKLYLLVTAISHVWV